MSELIETQAVRRSAWLSPLYLAVGYLATVLGVIGAFVPGLPTTVFLIVAVWAFSKSSDRMRNKIWNHPRFGPTLRAWHEYRVIPRHAKISAVGVMIASFMASIFLGQSWVLSIAIAGFMIPIACWICTRKSHIEASSTLGVKG
jgi:uncharacterized protein